MKAGSVRGLPGSLISAAGEQGAGHMGSGRPPGPMNHGSPGHPSLNVPPHWEPVGHGVFYLYAEARVSQDLPAQHAASLRAG